MNEVTTKAQPKTLAQWADSDVIIKKFAKAFGNNEKKAMSFLRSIASAVDANPLLKDADPMSILGAGMMAASLDLEVSPSLGQSAIIPYGKKAQFQIMTNGLVQLFFRSGQAKALNPFIVYKDEFNGFDKIKGELKPLKEHDDKCTEVAGFGCYMALTNGFEKTEYWSVEKVNRHRDKFSKSKNSGPWASHYEAMALKTVTKYCLNHFAPKDTKMQMAINADQAAIDLSIDSDDVDLQYVDNPENEIVTVFSEEEIQQRVDTIEYLNSRGIKDADIIRSWKHARSMDDVPTSHLNAMADAERS